MPTYCYNYIGGRVAMRTVPPDYVPQPGEYLSAPEQATDAQLQAFFVGYVAAKQSLLLYAANKAAEIERSGIAVDIGTPTAPDVVAIDTSMEYVTRLKVANDYAVSNPTATQAYAFAGGVQTLDASQVEKIYNSVVAFIGDVAAIHASAVSAIGAGSITSNAQIDALAWPANF